MKTIITGGNIVNEGRVQKGTVVIENGRISEVSTRTDYPLQLEDEVIDATGCYVLPGVIDDHVHFREPGLSQKGDIDTESRAAAAGGVTSFFDMPNCVPQTTTLEALEEKFQLAAQKSHVNYSFFFGATNDNADSFAKIDARRIPGIKLFMGSSTGNMLVDSDEARERIFKTVRLPLMVHCEDTAIIQRNMAEAQQAWGDDPPVEHHPWIRDAEACYRSSSLAVELAQETGARLHIAHVSTEKEVEEIGYGRRRMESGERNELGEREERPSSPRPITLEACVPHLLFCDEDYARLGTRIKCNPAIKSRTDRDALRHALAEGRIQTIATDHAPHLLSEKEGGCARAASGIPMIQFSLVSMLDLVDEGVLTLERMVDAMCHQPALLFGIRNRGFLRPGYKADIVLVRPEAWTLTKGDILSKCGWSPLEGHTFHWRIQQTFLNGHLAYDRGNLDDTVRGNALLFQKA